MATKIEWVRSEDGTAGKTWNPVVGCSRVSPGCDHCYAIRQAERIVAMGGKAAAAYEGTVADGDWTGVVRCLPERLGQPQRWRKPARVFVNSMSDLFHPAVPAEFIHAVWQSMANSPQHTFQILTKRPQQMREWVNEWKPVPLPNVWLGVSIESDRYSWRADHLRRTPAAVRFISAEPLIGPTRSLDLAGIDWVIAGGESGPGARPMHPAWARDLRDRSTAAGAAYFFKQWGQWRPLGPLYDADAGDDPEYSEEADLARSDAAGLATDYGDDRVALVERSGAIQYMDRQEYQPGRGTWLMFRVGRKRDAGRLLDGRTWDEMPR